jgi:excisionase family DNA binding protein
MTELLTVRAAADRLGVAYSTLKQWIYDGSIRTTKTRGGHHRIAESEVQRQLIAGKTSELSAPSVALVFYDFCGLVFFIHTLHVSGPIDSSANGRPAIFSVSLICP